MIQAYEKHDMLICDRCGCKIVDKRYLVIGAKDLCEDCVNDMMQEPISMTEYEKGWTA
jgi:formylmethanofuran dehydrogenase subunit E